MIITGLSGMGKTALVAETLALRETRFEWVLLYQAKPNCSRLRCHAARHDLKLRGELGRYYDHVQVHCADAIYQLAAGLGRDLQTSLRNYAIDFRRAHAASTDLAVPRVAELLADPAFYPLDQWLPPAPGGCGRTASRSGPAS